MNLVGRCSNYRLIKVVRCYTLSLSGAWQVITERYVSGIAITPFESAAIIAFRSGDASLGCCYKETSVPRKRSNGKRSTVNTEAPKTILKYYYELYLYRLYNYSSNTPSRLGNLCLDSIWHNPSMYSNGLSRVAAISSCSWKSSI